MAKEQYRNFMDYLWVQKEDTIYTIGINEEGLEEIEKIVSLDLPSEGETIEADVVLGTLETQSGTMDLYSPVSGTVSEVNSVVLEDPTLIQDDPYDGWLFKIESDEELPDEDEEEDEEEDDDDVDDEEEEEDEE